MWLSESEFNSFSELTSLFHNYSISCSEETCKTSYIYYWKTYYAFRVKRNFPEVEFRLKWKLSGGRVPGEMKTLWRSISGWNENSPEVEFRVKWKTLQRSSSGWNDISLEVEFQVKWKLTGVWSSVLSTSSRWFPWGRFSLLSSWIWWDHRRSINGTLYLYYCLLLPRNTPL